MRLRPRQRDKNLMIGSAFHETLGQWYRGRRADMSVIATGFANKLRNEIERAGDWFDQDDLDDAHATANTFVGMMCGYAAQYCDDRDNWRINRKSIEYKFCIDMGEFDFMGKMDLVANDKTLVEHKTASKIDDKYTERLPLDTQVRGYTFAARHKKGLDIAVDNVLYDVVRKCRLRRKANEDVDQFDERVANDYLERPSFYFYREPLPFDESHLAAFEHEMHQTHREYIALQNDGAFDDPRSWLPNDSRCYDFFRACEYVPLCAYGLTPGNAQHLEQTEAMHTELEEV
jgi:hypothetical protein